MSVHSPAARAGLDRDRSAGSARARLDDGAIAAAVHEAAVRATLAVGLAAIAVIHAIDSVGKWTETPYIFWMYMALIGAAVGTAAATLFTRMPQAFLAAAGLAAATMIGFILSRTTGLPSATGDIGNWTEPLGLASLVVEGLVVALGLSAFRHRV
jgi:hypothetical protein